MKLRLATYKNHATASQILACARKHDISQEEAKHRVIDQSETVLEYWVAFDPFGNGTWQQVPHETIFRNTP